MKTIYLLIALTVSLGARAQIEKVSLQASGLTCSMCSNSINKALKTLDFVERVDADVSNYTFEIYFKENSIVDFNRIRKKVEDAGFSVSGFTVTINFNNTPVRETQPLVIGNNSIILVNVKEEFLNGIKKIKVLDKGFVSPKEARRNSFALSEGTYHATI
jgi:copper chaperone CopZ